MESKRALEIDVGSKTHAGTLNRSKRIRRGDGLEFSPLKKLPGELRNRIYELAIADTVETSISITYKSIKSRKRYKNATAWANAHKFRHYMGLSQVCKLLRHEFRPLYLKAIIVRINCSQLPSYVDVFGENLLSRNQSDFVQVLRNNALPSAGLDILPMVQELTQSSIWFKFPDRSSTWTGVDLLSTLHSVYIQGFRINPSLHISKMTLLSLTQTTEPALIFKINLVLGQSLTKGGMMYWSRMFLERHCTYCFNGLVTVWRCGKWQWAWRIDRGRSKWRLSVVRHELARSVKI